MTTEREITCLGCVSLDAQLAEALRQSEQLRREYTTVCVALSEEKDRAAKWRELVVKLCKWFSEPGLANNAPTIWSGYTTKEKSIESECLLRECFAALGWPDPVREEDAK